MNEGGVLLKFGVRWEVPEFYKSRFKPGTIFKIPPYLPISLEVKPGYFLFATKNSPEDVAIRFFFRIQFFGSEPFWIRRDDSAANGLQLIDLNDLNECTWSEISSKYHYPGNSAGDLFL